MFSIFRTDPSKKLKKEYSDLLERAMSAQRNGDIRMYSDLTSKAEKLAQEIDALASKN